MQAQDVPVSAWVDQHIPQVHVNMQDEIAALPATAVAGFLKVDARPLKQALSTWVTKWIYVFTLYLQNKVRHMIELPC